VNNALILLQLMIALTEQAQRLQLLLQTAARENRDVTDDELNNVASGDDAARAALQSAIARAKAEGR
jgi:hypothetical protein